MFLTAVIIVIYKPDLLELTETINSIIKQVSYCIIVDNGNTKVNFPDFKNLLYFNLNKNYGIAYAQNIGIEVARKYNIEFIIFSDQDTKYSPDYIIKMLSFYNNYKKKEKLGAIVPRLYDKNKCCESKIALKKFSYIKPEKNKIYYVAHAISSGTFIPIKNFDKIGYMRDELFIDWVDYEWCWRALKMGYKIISIPDVSIEHMMGDSIINIAGRKIAIKKKLRYYYTIRNGIYIIKYLNVLNISEKILFGIDLLKKIIGLLFIENRIIYIIIKAINDGNKKIINNYV